MLAGSKSWPMLTKLGAASVLSIWLALTSGCYPDWPEHSGTAEVEGEVLLDGFPLNKASVVFVPTKLKNKSGKVMQLVYGKSDMRGMFKMEYADGSPDILAGDYYVLISLMKSKEDPQANNLLVKNENFERSLTMIHRNLPSSNATIESQLEAIEAMDRNQVVPALYNRETTLEYKVVASPGIVRTKFELSSIDPLIK